MGSKSGIYGHRACNPCTAITAETKYQHCASSTNRYLHPKIQLVYPIEKESSRKGLGLKGVEVAGEERGVGSGKLGVGGGAMSVLSVFEDTTKV